MADVEEEEAPISTTIITSGPQSKQRLLFMGLKRSGKSSIINVVLYKLPPTETVFIPTTRAIKKHALRSYRTFPIWDLPGQIDYTNTDFDIDYIFGPAGAMVWVLDAQDDYVDSITRLTDTILQLQQSFPDIHFTVFIHKTDSLSADFRDDAVNDIIQRIVDDLADAGLENPPVSFYATSVYDDSIHEALSKVVQLLNPHLATFEALLNTIGGACKMQKLYLFDIVTKVYVAADTSPVDILGYAVCSDYIDTVVDLSEIYGWERTPPGKATAAISNGESTNEDTEASQGIVAPAPATDAAAAADVGVESFIGGVKGYCLYLKEVHRKLALIGLSKEPRFAEQKPLIDYNITVFQDALTRVLALV